MHSLFKAFIGKYENLWWLNNFYIQHPFIIIKCIIIHIDKCKCNV